MDNKGLLVLGAVVVGGVLLVKRGSGDVSSNENMTIKIVPAALNVGMAVAGVATGLGAGISGNLIQITVKNNSVYQGTTIQAPYTFQLTYAVYGSLVTNWLLKTVSVALGAGGQTTIDDYFAVPINEYGTFHAEAQLYNTAKTAAIGPMLTVTGPITGAVITPGGSLSW